MADSFLAKVELEDEVRNSCCEMVQIFHTTTSELANKFLQNEKRHYYVTPTSYLELITTFTSLLEQKRASVRK